MSENTQSEDGGMSYETAMGVIQKQGLQLANVSVQKNVLEVEREQMLARIEELEKAQTGQKAKAAE